MTEETHAERTKTHRYRHKARHAAPRGRRARRTMSAMRYNVLRTVQPARVPRLEDCVITSDTSVRQAVIRAAQTRAFGLALIAALIITWLGAAVTEGFLGNRTTHYPPISGAHQVAPSSYPAYPPPAERGPADAPARFLTTTTSCFFGC